ncbi:hypothetical protein TL16_g07890 [Triparma laevis f. inornata]|uniref:Berberine/berberine-like domain-containing protein n=1 Tax=Triparma laevis f. inornata TaxID=1714386 RepID=A0A9W7AY33_9STRA|nr:hypothetical protein TL16_g07890 [Triparma laevis f. inornata]
MIFSGGGNTWGVITSLTLLTHSLPESGATMFQFSVVVDDYCDMDMFSKIMDSYMELLPTVDERWSGLTFFIPKALDDSAKCSLQYTRSPLLRRNIFNQYVFLGTEEEAHDVVGSMAAIGLQKTLARKITTWNDDYVKMADPEYLFPTPFAPNKTLNFFMPSDTRVGGVPSVLVPREKSADVGQAIKNRFNECAANGLTQDGICGWYEIYHAVSGNAKEPFDADSVSITSSFRNTLYHLVDTGNPSHDTMDAVYELLGDHCYQSECAYEISEAAGGWKKRVYGEQYDKLLAIKMKYDPDEVFWCRHCIGDEE